MKNRLLPTLKLLTAILLAVFAVSALGNGSLTTFSTISNAKLDNELPVETGGSAASIQKTLRPALTYPSLQVHGQQHAASAQVKDEQESRARQIGNTRSEFESLVQSSIGTPLPTYGRDLFRISNDAYQVVDQVNVPADFLIGPGDELHIQAWGSIDIDTSITVERTGNITLPKIGVIPVSGVRFVDLEDHLAAAIRRVYHGFELSIALGQLKSIRIFVSGFAAAPGSYTVNSLSSLINAVFLSGGPAPTGDLRKIELRRAGKTVVQLDLYDFLMAGNRNNNIKLQPNDLIYVPPLLGQAAVAGSVNQPAIFHLSESDSFADLLRFAGGLSPAASVHRLVVERFGMAGERKILEFPINDATLALKVMPGDILLVKPSSPRFQNAITLRGQVAQPLRHEWREDMRVSDLLPSSEALISPSYWAAKNTKDATLFLANESGEAALPIDFPDINWNYAVVERIERRSLSVSLIPFNLKQAISEHGSEQDLELQPGDTIYVFSSEDFRSPVDNTRRFVRIEGEVANVGIYPVGQDDTLEDLIEQAGGLTRHAYLFGLELQRESIRQQQAVRKEAFIDRLDEDYQRHLIDRSRNVLSGDLSLAINPESNAIASLITKLRSVEATGRILINQQRSLTDSSQLPELTLRNNDRIYIPPLPDTVEVVGAVLQSGSTLFQSGMRVKDCLTQAGLIRTADRREIYLVRPNGSFVKVDERAELVPGDTIVVPEKVDRLSTVRRLKDWTQVLYQFGLGAAGIRLLTDT